MLILSNLLSDGMSVDALACDKTKSLPRKKAFSLFGSTTSNKSLVELNHR